ncbi:Xenotropic and polytropic retrovirus receptor 1 [Marasmius sp. AFHP31]|nr:Xenotropic and polytropic retrovirus receptor 1 [Marasmius sp. AFHP31]
MKFARYLEDTQTPEWKRAYIDYRGLKKRITKIRTESENDQWKTAIVTSPVQQDQGGPSNPTLHFEGRPSDASSTDSASNLRSRVQAPDKPIQDGIGRTRETLRRSLTARFRSRRMGSTLSVHRGGHEPMPLNTLYTVLTAEQKKFFEALDVQLAKVEQFYVAREKELRERSTLLQSQLNELRQHRETFHSAQERRAREWARFKLDPLAVILPTPLGKRKGKDVSRDSSISPPRQYFDPDEYHTAKKRLKKAVVEHYRLIELLHNYRVLNITGFRKALKKFEKVTGVPAQKAYMTEKVETSAFSTGQSLRSMMNEMEALYTSRFVRGNRKAAMAHLRGVNAHKTHHFSSFRTGIMLGVAVPALVSGIYKSEVMPVRFKRFN